MKWIYKTLGVIVLCAMFACTKDHKATIVQVTQADSGKVVYVKPGETIVITLADPGDGGYTFNAPQYYLGDLKFLTQFHQDPPPGGATGSYGTETWEYAATNEGAFQFIVTASRTDTTITVFNTRISISNK